MHIRVLATVQWLCSCRCMAVAAYHTADVVCGRLAWLGWSLPGHQPGRQPANCCASVCIPHLLLLVTVLVGYCTIVDGSSCVGTMLLHVVSKVASPLLAAAHLCL
jgi:hypothetical protein